MKNKLSKLVLAACLIFSTSAMAQEKSGKSAEEIARDLANPNTPLASLTFKFQFRTYEGDLPNADDQNGTTLLFQPTLPFPLTNGDKVLFRPAIPLQFDQPVYNAGKLDFDDEFGLGDISFDLAYAKTTDKGLLLAGGIISTVPTATDDKLGKDRFTLGPEFMIGNPIVNVVSLGKKNNYFLLFL